MMVLDDSEIVQHIEWSVPKRYQRCRFSTFDAYTNTLIQKVAAIEKLIADRRGLFIFGPVGTGKTHLGVAALAEYIRMGATYKFIGAAEYVNAVQEAFGNPKAIVGELVDRNIVLIDDLASEKGTESARSSLFFLIDALYGRRKKVIVTTNQTPKEIHAWEPRIMSRLTEMCGLVELVAEDFRIRAAGQRKKLVQPITREMEAVNFAQTEEEPEKDLYAGQDMVEVVRKSGRCERVLRSTALNWLRDGHITEIIEPKVRCAGRIGRK